MTEKVFRLTFYAKSTAQGRYQRSTPAGEIDEIKKLTFNVTNYIVNDIAFKATKSQQRNVAHQLEAKFTGIAMTELRNMARKIAATAIGIGPGNRWPQGGNLGIEGGISQTLQRTDPDRVRNMSIKAVTGQWRARTEEYLRRKSKKFGHRKWFLNTGELRAELSNPSMYLAAYGPVRVAWTPERIDKNFSTGAAVRYSNLARGVGRTYTVTTGHIHMTILGRITREMLNDPGERAFDSRFSGLLDPLPEMVEKKLANRGDPYRALLEPFLTFYLNRQIPNAIWRSLEKSIKPLGVSH